MALNHLTSALAYQEQKAIHTLTRGIFLNIFWRLEVSGLAIASHLTKFLRYFKSVRRTLFSGFYG
jgi:hypothetical protein